MPTSRKTRRVGAIARNQNRSEMATQAQIRLIKLLDPKMPVQGLTKEYASQLIDYLKNLDGVRPV